jgi:hypothetical protein
MVKKERSVNGRRVNAKYATEDIIRSGSSSGPEKEGVIDVVVETIRLVSSTLNRLSISHADYMKWRASSYSFFSRLTLTLMLFAPQPPNTRFCSIPSHSVF